MFWSFMNTLIKVHINCLRIKTCVIEMTGLQAMRWRAYRLSRFRDLVELGMMRVDVDRDPPPPLSPLRFNIGIGIL